MRTNPKFKFKYLLEFLASLMEQYNNKQTFTFITHQEAKTNFMFISKSQSKFTLTKSPKSQTLISFINLLILKSVNAFTVL